MALQVQVGVEEEENTSSPAGGQALWDPGSSVGHDHPSWENIVRQEIDLFAYLSGGLCIHSIAEAVHFVPTTITARQFPVPAGKFPVVVSADQQTRGARRQ